MAENERLVKCEQRRHDCVMCNSNGKCVALNDTTFKRGRKTYKCPFYKARKDAEVIPNAED